MSTSQLPPSASAQIVDFRTERRRRHGADAVRPPPEPSTAAGPEEPTAGPGRQGISLLAGPAVTDELTGLLNRHGFHLRFLGELERGRRQTLSGILILADIDGFEEINRRHGRTMGDAYLRQVGAQLLRAVRADDPVGRLSDDLFGVVLTNIGPATGMRRAEEIRAGLNRTQVICAGRSLPVRLSLGAHAFDPSESEEEIFGAADWALYADKRTRQSAG